MKVTRTRKAIATLAGGAFLSTLGAGALAQTDASDLFGIEDLDGGYMLAAKADAEGKCGEGKCGGDGADKDAAEGKCGEGKCGGDGADKDAAEGKCGEGKCGGAG